MYKEQTVTAKHGFSACELSLSSPLYGEITCYMQRVGGQYTIVLYVCFARGATCSYCTVDY